MVKIYHEIFEKKIEHLVIQFSSVQITSLLQLLIDNSQFDIEAVRLDRVGSTFSHQSKINFENRDIGQLTTELTAGP